jgi:pimeloyl-ACP methyl ester carboxylesterase
MQFERQTLAINGIDTVVLRAGSGDPLLYLHGAGTATRFDFMEPWTKRFEVIVPFHPGFGESADDPAVTEIHDFVLHYLELFEALDLPRFNLVGQSMGGFIATKLAVEHRYLIERLALVCPVGIPIPEHPTADFLAVPPEELPALLAYDPAAVFGHLPAGAPSEAFLAERAKEGATAARVLSPPYDPKLPRYLHRLTMPTLLVWGKDDQLAPAIQHRTWLKYLPRVETRLVDKAGHLVLEEAPDSLAAIAEFFER